MSDLSLDWLISNHGEFLKQFGIDEDKIIAGYALSKKNNSSDSVLEYFYELHREASLYNIKNANTEQEFYNSQLQLNTKALELSIKLKKVDINYWLEQIHFDKLMISWITLPFKFDVQIDSGNCCPFCAKKDKKIFSLEKVFEKKYLPFSKCKRGDVCSCSYSIVPLYDESGKLLPNDFLGSDI